MPDTNVESFILRFRDLVTTPGGTIDSHKNTIEAKTYAWWGWWNKAGESIPFATFSELKRIASSKGLPIFLYDSGRATIFSAICTDIEYNTISGRIPSPGKIATPPYYSEQEYKAWFKITSITDTPLDETELAKWTYVSVDEFFEHGKSRYRSFYGKQVSSLKELRDQDRSIWFIRPWTTGDPTHEVSLLDAVTLSPMDFPQDFSVNTGSTLLWISDLHFSGGEEHGFPLDATVATFPLWHRIENAVNKYKSTEIAGVLASGDFAWKAKREEFDAAQQCISEITKKLRLKNYDLLFCPGNHDIAFSEDQFKNAQPIVKNLDEASQEYRHFYDRFFYKEPNEYLASGRRVVLGRSVSVEIAALNSNFLQQKPNVFQGHGFVGQPQLEYVTKEMGWDKPQENELPIRMVMLHHHLLPVTFTEIPVEGQNYSVTLDAEAITKWIVQHNVKVVLHGHMHQPFYAKVERSMDHKAFHGFWVLGMGSAGVSQSHLGEVQKNTIGLLQFSPAEILFSAITLHPTNPPSLLWKIPIPMPKG